MYNADIIKAHHLAKAIRIDQDGKFEGGEVDKQSLTL